MRGRAVDSRTPRGSGQPGEGVNGEELAAGLAPTPGYRYATAVGDELFVAGQVPLDGDGDLIGRNDAAAQAQDCLDNLETHVLDDTLAPPVVAGGLSDLPDLCGEG